MQPQNLPAHGFFPAGIKNHTIASAAGERVDTILVASIAVVPQGVGGAHFVGSFPPGSMARCSKSDITLVESDDMENWRYIAAHDLAVCLPNGSSGCIDPFDTNIYLSTEMMDRLRTTHTHTVKARPRAAHCRWDAMMHTLYVPISIIISPIGSSFGFVLDSQNRALYVLPHNVILVNPNG
jgi:hypothetical protein